MTSESLSTYSSYLQALLNSHNHINMMIPYSRVSPVEVLYAALPTFLYFNSSFVWPLLRPLLDSQVALELPYLMQCGTSVSSQ